MEAPAACLSPYTGNRTYLITFARQLIQPRIAKTVLVFNNRETGPARIRTLFPKRIRTCRWFLHWKLCQLELPLWGASHDGYHIKAVGEISVSTAIPQFLLWLQEIASFSSYKWGFWTFASVSLPYMTGFLAIISKKKTVSTNQELCVRVHLIGPLPHSQYVFLWGRNMAFVWHILNYKGTVAQDFDANLLYLLIGLT